MKTILALFIALVLITAGCTQASAEEPPATPTQPPTQPPIGLPGGPPPEPVILTVGQLLDGKEEWVTTTVTLMGTLRYQAAGCTEISCMFGTACEPGTTRSCNSCFTEIFLEHGNRTIELRKEGDPAFTCTAREIMVCGGETRYDYSDCLLGEGSTYIIKGVLREEERTDVTFTVPGGDGYTVDSRPIVQQVPHYYIEVESYIEVWESFEILEDG